MDVTHKDFNTLLGIAEQTKDMLDWQLPSDIPTLNRVAELNGRLLKILKSYLDDDSESTTQLELFPEVGEEEIGYNNW